ncbi:MAG TPA: DUF29 family protein [Stellaceae bacterium]|jgi:hypothetical protein
MPEGLRIADLQDDPHAWVRTQAALLRRGDAGLKTLDSEGLSDFLEEWADDMLSTARSHMVNLMAHAAKVAKTRNPDVIGHWRSECVEFHDRLIEAYRPSMRDRIDSASLWRRALRKVFASFDDHGEPRPSLPAQCPVSLDDLVDPELDLDRLVATIRGD